MSGTSWRPRVSTILIICCQMVKLTRGWGERVFSVAKPQISQAAESVLVLGWIEQARSLLYTQDVGY